MNLPFSSAVPVTEGALFGALKVIRCHRPPQPSQLRVGGRPARPQWDLACLCGEVHPAVPEGAIERGAHRFCRRHPRGGVPVRSGKVWVCDSPPLGLWAKVLAEVAWRPELARYSGLPYTRLTPYFRVAVIAHGMKMVPTAGGVGFQAVDQTAAELAALPDRWAPGFIPTPEDVASGWCVLLYLNELQIRALAHARHHPLLFYGPAVTRLPDGAVRHPGFTGAEDCLWQPGGEAGDRPTPRPVRFRKKPQTHAGGRPYRELTGQLFGHWKVLPPDETLLKAGADSLLCRCVCGTARAVRRKALLAQRQQTTHGASLCCGCQNHALVLKAGFDYGPARTVSARGKIKRRLVATPAGQAARGSLRVHHVERRDAEGRYGLYCPDRDGPLPSSRALVKTDPPAYRVVGQCVCGTPLKISLVEARGRALSSGCRCSHYREETPLVAHLRREYAAIVCRPRSVYDPAGRRLMTSQHEKVVTREGPLWVPVTVADRLEGEGKLWERPEGWRYGDPAWPDQVRPGPKVILGPDFSWRTFEGFCREVGAPAHRGQTLVKKRRNQPWTAANVAWCFAQKRVFKTEVTPELIAKAQRPGFWLVERRVPAGHGFVYRLTVERRPEAEESASLGSVPEREVPSL